MVVGEKRKSSGDIQHEESETKRNNVTKESNVFIGIDIGTQGAKAILYHPSSQTIKARSAIKYDLDEEEKNERSEVSGRAEQHPIKWTHALHSILKKLSITINDNDYIVGGIGVSGQQHGMVALDKNYNVIRSSKLWCDVEASKQATAFSSQATKTMNKAWDIPAGFTAPKVLWMKEEEPANFDRMKWIVLPHDYVNLCLRTGIGCTTDDVSCLDLVENHGLVIDESIVPTTDAGDASGTGIICSTSREYVHDLAKIIDERYYTALPQILQPSEVCGVLNSLWKKSVNVDINNSYSIPISVGSGDNMMSALGCKCVSPGNAVLSLGTSGTIFGVSLTPVQTGTPVAPFCDATGKHLPLVCVMNCTGVLNSVLESWCNPSKEKPSISHEEATNLAKASPPGCNGLTFLPYLGGERTPNWPHARGALLGINSQNIDCMSAGNPGLVYRAAMEGITFLLKDALEQMRTSCGDGFNPNSIMVVGGGSKNKFWRQMIADVFDVELRFPVEPESAALGAAFQAGAAVSNMNVDEYVLKQNVQMEEEVLTPTYDEKTKQLYADAFQAFKTVSRKLYN